MIYFAAGLMRYFSAGYIGENEVLVDIFSEEYVEQAAPACE
jgi:hypothetical protein